MDDLDELIEGLDEEDTAEILPAIIDMPEALVAISAKLAFELVCGLRDEAEILKAFDIDEAGWNLLKLNRAFVALLRETEAQWNSGMNAQTRARAKAQIAAEESIPTVYGIIMDKDAPYPSRIEAFSKLSRMGGLEKPPEDAVAAGPAFSIVINTGPTEKPIVIESPTTD